MTEGMDHCALHYVLPTVKHASTRTGSLRINWKIQKMCHMITSHHNFYTTFAIQYKQELISHSNGQHFVWVRAHWGCKQAAGIEEYGLSLMCEMTEAKLPLASLFWPNGNEADVRFSLSLKQARCFLLWALAGMSNNDVLRHALQLKPPSSSEKLLMWLPMDREEKKKHVEELATNFTLHPSWVQRAR